MKFTCKACGAKNEVESQQSRAAKSRWKGHKKKVRRSKLGRPPKNAPQAPSKPVTASEPKAGIYICGVCNTPHTSLGKMKDCLKTHRV